MTKDQILELINKRYITRVMSDDELKELESKTIDDLKGSGLATHIDTPEQDGNDDVKGTPVSEVIEEIKTKVEPVAKKSKASKESAETAKSEPEASEAKEELYLDIVQVLPKDE